MMRKYHNAEQIRPCKLVRERNEALKSLNEKKIKAYANKYGIQLPKDKEIFWAGIHKARLQITAITEEEKLKSLTWLTTHGFKAEMW